MKKWTWYISLPLLGVILYLIIPSGEETDYISTKVEKGPFDLVVKVTGVLQAEDSEDISGPNLRSLSIYDDIKITDMVPEGTIVDSGDYVATLDRTSVMTKMEKLQSELEEIEAKRTQKLIDTTITLREARNRMKDLQYELMELELELERSQYETPAAIRQLEIKLDKSKRAYKQAVDNYSLQEAKAVAEVQEVEAQRTQKELYKEQLEDVMKDFVVHAPEKGMVIYRRYYNGEKLKAGSTIHSYNPTVASLPDMSSMISRTYVSEVDISKIKMGQAVEVRLDAFPERAFEGKVEDVANVGVNLPDHDSQMFEVVVKLASVDSIMRPGMTTRNDILINHYEEVIHIPLVAIQAENDSSQYVYILEGDDIRKQKVQTGPSNEDEIIITKGLKNGDQVLLSAPETENEINQLP